MTKLNQSIIDTIQHISIVENNNLTDKVVDCWKVTIPELNDVTNDEVRRIANEFTTKLDSFIDESMASKAIHSSPVTCELRVKTPDEMRDEFL